MFNKFRFLLGEGFKNLWRFKRSTFTSIVSVCLTLYLVGILFIAGKNSQKVMLYLRSKYKIEVFFKTEIDDVQAAAATREIQKIPGVRSATLITKADAAQIFHQQFGEDILELLDYNPLPASCVVNISRQQTSALDVRPIIQKIQLLEAVDEINYQGRLIRILENAYVNSYKIITIAAVIILLVTISIISNTIKLTFYARRDLVRTLRIVGASNMFIKFPFIVDGILQGLAGALAATLVLYGTILAGNHFISLVTGRVRISGDPLVGVWLIVVAVLVGMIGASRATAKLLK